ncbi:MULTISPECIES: FMN reductase [unclassified Mesorhizobium]|uniref:FMN reductase n=1 Tax=unclassified Mesorhizobium TaxID=325217 RepID=UPI000FD5A858|nr:MULTISPECIES: FMN reductase [unclassified Mesorhizobium]RVB80491.1 FMN reductase [Mesorhizobium sp. M6A.T.Cr.TU.014.01.1.1]RWQ10594.1 MAG: FMN reductase [Mesorhizobium sp.]RWQ10923.1 MAG: FMN reductase [Mesorhizobium sp.]
MSHGKLVGLVGNFSRPSKSYALVETVAGLVRDRYGLRPELYDLTDIGPSLGNARRHDDLDISARQVVQKIISADVLVVGSPTYKGSYTVLFKHFFDLIDPLALQGKPVILTATGGGDRHALIVEHQLRPLFGFFMAHTLPSAVYAADRDFSDYRLASEPIRRRAEQAVAELGAFFPQALHHAVAAE